MNFKLNIPLLKGIFIIMRRVSVFCYLCFTLLCTVFVCSSCAISSTNSTSATLRPPVDWKLSQDSERIYQLLKLFSATTEKNTEDALSAARTLSELNPTPDILGEVAVVLLINGQVAEAKDIALSGLKKAPFDERLNYLLAEIYTQEKRYQDALAILLNYQKNNKNKAELKNKKADKQEQIRTEKELQQEIARLYLLSGFNSEAEQYIRKISQRGPLLDYYLGQALFAQSKINEAEKSFLSSVEKAPSFEQAYLALAALYEKQERWNKAAEMRKKVFDFDPDNDKYHGALIYDLLQANDFKGVNSVLDGSVQNVEFLLDVASVMYANKQYEQAELLLKNILSGKYDSKEQNDEMSVKLNFEQSNQQNKENSKQALEIPVRKIDANYLLGALVYESKKDADTALKYLKLIPQNSRFYQGSVNLIVYILLNQGKKQEAIAFLDNSIKETPNNLYFLKIKTDMYISDKEYQKALDLLNKALKDFPKDVELRYSYGAVLEEMGRSDESLAVMEELVKEFPFFAGALNYVGYTLTEQGKDLDRAAQLLERAYAQAPDNPHIIDSFAWVKFKKKDYKKAWNLIKRAVELSGKDAVESVIWEHYGMIAEAMGDKKEALKGYKSALEAKHEKPEFIQQKIDNLKKKP
ncbi:tetratricopeptide repeat protein [Desulfovibrio litoralis]|uniref:Tetratricopeptide repeat-containing protein n=1 Tax=Desulfovibrio litoralis DSM 11393 TaxID=1121455 RepID=A0A1M7T5J9_9BACT|nr:tetratricopeptide repeat protein [Desulfovibrio litoralis]SHN65975.1 Tetratricopeptide repeat-containing protein [Desulfovibrio litoralis DSM 11393]